MDIIKISLLGVCGVILGFLMKGTKPEYACFITVGIGLVIMGLSVMLRTKSVVHIVVFILFLVVGWGWVLNVIDLIYMVLTGHLILGD